MPLPACGPLFFALLLSACGDRYRPSAAESEQLDNAADLLDSAPGRLANIDGNSAPADSNSAERPPSE